jgi:precorrin-6A/cobalt-precorrin-6A reductase
MKLLILGGTSDAIKLCKLALQKYTVIYSIKGIVRQPQLNCEVHSGGFDGVQGLIAFLHQQRIDCLVDATHPYAMKISHYAELAAKHGCLPCFHYIRPAWQQQSGDDWIFFDNMMALTSLLNTTSKQNLRLFFTIGQLSSEFLARKNPQQDYIVRSAIASTVKQANKIEWINSIGPFELENERQCFHHYQVDALISKNSGGESVAAKIKIAAEMKLPVYMRRRPDFHSKYPLIHSIADILLVLKQLKRDH